MADPLRRVPWPDFCIVTGIVCLPFFINGYPIVFYDSGSYARFFRPDFFLPDRPIFYGIFVYFSSLFSLSLRFVPVVQGMLFSFLFLRLCAFWGIMESVKKYFVYLLLAFSYVPLFLSTVMPDFLIMPAVIACLLLGFEKDRPLVMAYCAVIALSIVCVPANFPVIAGSLLCTCIVLFFMKKHVGYARITAAVICIGVLSLLLCSFSTYVAYKRFSPIYGGNAFMLAKLSQNGLAKRQIDAFCEQQPGYLCEEKAAFAEQEFFLWSGRLDRFGGWEDTGGQQGAFIRAILANHFGAFAATGVRDTGKMLALPAADIKSLFGERYGEDKFIYKLIRDRLPQDFYFFRNAAQIAAPEPLNRYIAVLHAAYLVQIVLAILALAVRVAQKRITASDFFLVAVFFMNDIVYAFLSEIVPRYHYKSASVCLLLILTVAVAAYGRKNGEAGRSP